MCPGTTVLAALPEIRRRVADELGGIPPLAGGYTIVAPNGRHTSFGAMPAAKLAAPASVRLAGLAARRDGKGYWGYNRGGGVFAVGTARFHGAIAGTGLNAPIVGLAPTPSGGGYWLAAQRRRRLRLR